MDVQVHCEGGRWLIGRGFKLLDTGGISGRLGRSAGRVREVYESWDGKRWGWSRSMALMFTTEDEAADYLYANWNRLHGLE